MIRKKTSTAEPVATVAKALVALRCFVDGQDEWGVRELSVALDMPPSTVHRMLARLRMEGFLQYNKAKQKYNIGFEFARLSAAVMQRHSLRGAAQSLMQELTQRTGESVWLALYDEDQVRTAYIAESESPHASSYIAPLGRTQRVIDSACGIAILAGMPAAQRAAALKAAGIKSVGEGVAEAIEGAAEAGYAVLRASEVSSAMMIAAAVQDAAGQPVGSLGVIVPMHRFGVGQDKNIGLMVLDAARRLSAKLGAKLLGGASVGSWRDALGVISGLLREAAPSLALSPTLGGGGRNLSDIDNGQGAYGLTAASSLYDARHGRGQFKQPHESLRAVMHLSELHFLVLTRPDIDIEQFSDLSRLRISPGEQGFSSAQAFRDALSVNLDGRKAARRGGATLFLDYPEGRRQLESGGVDALVWMSSFSNPLLGEMAAARSARLLGLDERMVDALVEMNPGYRRGIIPAQAFPGWLNEDVLTISVPTVLVCRADRPEDEVRQFARTLYENRDRLSQLSPVYEGFDASLVLNGLTAPLHPGAEQFFRQEGIRPYYAA